MRIGDCVDTSMHRLDLHLRDDIDCMYQERWDEEAS